MTVNMCVSLGPLSLKNPVMPGSGTYGYGNENAQTFPLNLLGAVVAKSVRLELNQGNPPPRLVETPAGLLNAVGVQTEGVETFIKSYMPVLRETGTRVIVSIAAKDTDGYGVLADRLSSVCGIDAIELNLSCPNIGQGLPFAQDVDLLSKAVHSARSHTTLPLIAKLSPNVTSIVEMARVAVDSGADVLCISNTLHGMAIDINTRRPILGSISGGLSGPAIRPVALRNVWKVREKLVTPIIGSGGIYHWQDAVEFLLAGASAVQVGTANFSNPNAMPEIIQGIHDYLVSNGFGSISEIVGLAHI
jgi:dihydroorotate dehydrogenase (NAD+) catalytic subunit